MPSAALRGAVSQGHMYPLRWRAASRMAASGEDPAAMAATTR